jgi:uncharacterized protein (DUF433 family)
MSGSLAHGLRLRSVVGDPPSRQHIANERFGRHDAMDQPMLAAARLAMDLVLPTEKPAPTLFLIRSAACTGCGGSMRRQSATAEWTHADQHVRRSRRMTSPAAPLITCTPGVRSGKPCLAGTRITVADVLEHHASGMSQDAILADFPDLQPVHIQAVLRYAAEREKRLSEFTVA